MKLIKGGIIVALLASLQGALFAAFTVSDFKTQSVDLASQLDVDNSAQVINAMEIGIITATEDLKSQETAEVEAEAEELADDSLENVDPELLSDLLNYPNPFRESQGTTIGYRLSKPMDIKLQVFDMLGSMIWEEDFAAGDNGGDGGLAQSDYNEVPFNTEVVGSKLPAGVYVYTLIFEGKMLGKGKMMVLP